MAAILILAWLHGLVYVSIMPPWQHYDEPGHFERAWLIANRGAFLEAGEPDPALRQEVYNSLVASGFFRGAARPAPEAFWQRALSQQDDPAFYYFLVSLPLRALSLNGVDIQLYAMRLASLGFLLLSVFAAYGASSELVPPGHPLRLMVPFSLAALPGFIDLMSAVNNDAAAVAFFSLFLWAGLRLMMKGLSPLRVIATAAAALLCLLAKNTVFIALPLFLLALLFAALPDNRRRWALVGVAAVALVAAAAALIWRDAASWYRVTAQKSATRQRIAGSPLGDYALQLDPAAARTPSWLDPLLQPLPVAASRDLSARAVTLGAWVWASVPAPVALPALHDGLQVHSATVEAGTEPAFHAYTVQLPERTDRLWVSLDPRPVQGVDGLRVFYDGLALVEGARPEAEPPRFSGPEGESGVWGGAPFTNLLRNPSAEKAGVGFRPWLDDLGASALPDQSRPSMVLSTLLDPAAAGWYYRAAAENMFRTFWGRFGWGHVPLYGGRPYRVLAIATALGVAGAGLALWLRRRRLRWDLVAWIVVLLLGTWGATLVRGSIYVVVKDPFIPVARYAYPAIIPTMLLLNLGWLELMRQVIRRVPLALRYQLAGYVALFLAFDLYSIYSIIKFYA